MLNKKSSSSSCRSGLAWWWRAEARRSCYAAWRRKHRGPRRQSRCDMLNVHRTLWAATVCSRGCAVQILKCAGLLFAGCAQEQTWKKEAEDMGHAEGSVVKALCKASVGLTDPLCVTKIRADGVVAVECGGRLLVLSTKVAAAFAIGGGATVFFARGRHCC